jgi:hypothetical protein
MTLVTEGNGVGTPLGGGVVVSGGSVVGFGLGGGGGGGFLLLLLFNPFVFCAWSRRISNPSCTSRGPTIILLHQKVEPMKAKEEFTPMRREFRSCLKFARLLLKGASF